MRLRASVFAPIVLAVLVALACAVGCSTKLPHPPYAPHPMTALVEVRFPPPPARAEQVVARPADNAVWIDGEWAWRGRRWSWKVGRWVVPPPGATYSPWTATRNEEGTLFFAPGTWRNAKGEELPSPAPLALGVAKSGALVNSEGETEHPGRNDTRERNRQRRDNDASTSDTPDNDTPATTNDGGS